MSSFQIHKTRNLPNGGFVDLFSLEGELKTQHMEFSHRDADGVNVFNQTKVVAGDSFDSIV